MLYFKQTIDIGSGGLYDDFIVMPNITLMVPESYLPWIEKIRRDMGVRSRHALLLMAIESFVKIPHIEAPEPPKESDSWPEIEVVQPCPECRPSLYNGRPINPPKHCGGGYRLTIENPNTKKRERWTCSCRICLGESKEEYWTAPPPKPIAALVTIEEFLAGKNDVFEEDVAMAVGVPLVSVPHMLEKNGFKHFSENVWMKVIA